MSTPLWLCCENQQKAWVQRKEANPALLRGWDKRKLQFTQKGSDPEPIPNWLGRKYLMRKLWTDDGELFQAAPDIPSAEHHC